MIKTKAISMTTSQPEVTMMMHGQKTRFTKFEKMVAVFSSFMNHNKNNTFKVEKIQEDSLDLIPLPSPSVKIQIMGGKVCLRCKDKTLLGLDNKCLKTKSLLTSPSNVLTYYLNETFLPII